MIRQFLNLISGRAAAALLQLGTIAWLTLLVSPAQMGVFLSVLGALLVVQSGADLGISTYVIRRRSSGSDCSIALSVAAFVVGVVFALTALFVLGLSTLISVPLYVYLMVAWSFFERLNDTQLAIPIADGNARVPAAMMVLRKLGGLGGIGLSSVVGSEALAGYGLGSVLVSSLVVGVLAIVSRRNWVIRLRPFAFRDLLWVVGSSRTYLANSVVTQVRNFDVVLLSVLVGAAAASTYGLASRLTTPLRMISSTFALILIPVAARGGAADWRPALKATGVVALVSSSVFALVALLFPFAYRFGFASEYERLPLAIAILCVGLVPATVASQLVAVLQGWGIGGFAAVSSALMSVICLLGVVLAGRIDPVLAPSISFAVAQLAQALLLSMRVKYEVKRRETA